MAKFEVDITVKIGFVYEVEAATEAEAIEIARNTLSDEANDETHVEGWVQTILKTSQQTVTVNQE